MKIQNKTLKKYQLCKQNLNNFEQLVFVIQNFLNAS